MLPEYNDLAVVVIASEKRKRTTFTQVMESVLAQDPDEVVVVADFTDGDGRWRHLVCSPITRTTIDALVKRDAGLVATTSRFVMFLSDDHCLGPNFVKTFKEKYVPGDKWDFLAPNRFTVRGPDTHWLNMGEADAYVAGHGGIYKRTTCQMVPWACTFHHRNWDVFHSHQLHARGARLVYAGLDLAIEDIEPGAEPWL